MGLAGNESRAPMKRRAIIHAGLEKTGSTAIQAWLDTNREALAQAGVLVPRALGGVNHTRLVAACLDDGVTDNIKAHFLSRKRLSEAAFRASVRADLEAELRDTAGWNHLVITSELISSRLHSPTEVDRLLDWVAPHVDEINVVFFLRRQDDLAVSRYSSALRAGHAGFDDIWTDLSSQSFLSVPSGRITDDAREYFDYSRILSRFEARPGVRITVLPYRLPGDRADGVAAFRALLGLGRGGQAGSLIHANAALSAEAQYIISVLNQDHHVQFPDGTRNEPYRALLRRIEAEQRGTRRTVRRAEALAFVARFGESNARVAERYCPDGLFADGFDQWPEAVDYRPMIAALAPVLARYRAEATALPRTARARPAWPRFWEAPLRRVIGR